MPSKYYSLKTDKEFKRIKQPLDEQDYNALEESIFDTGCTSPILVWNNIIIDGYKRYEICKCWQLPYETNELRFKSRDDALAYICVDQLKRTDLSKEATSYLIGKHFEALKAVNAQLASEKIMKEKLAGITHSAGRHTNFSNQTAIELGKLYGVSHNTVYKYGVYARCIDIVWEKEADIVRKIFSGKLKISHQNVLELSRLPKYNLRTLNEHLSTDGIEHIGYSEMRHELQWKRISAATNPSPKPEPPHEFQIKKLPEYDPNAEIASLSLTIPSWNGTIQRVKNSTDFTKISKEARQNLLRQLYNLYEAVSPLVEMLREDKHHE